MAVAAVVFCAPHSVDTTVVHGKVVVEDGRIVTAMTLGFTDEGKVDQIYIVRNPEKLERLAAPTRHDPSNGALWQ